MQSKDEAEKLLNDFWQRGVESVVVNEHLKGDLIKFYGVEGTDFFYWFYPSKRGHRSKFGLEVINGDGPSFAPCRDEAAFNIAMAILNKM